MNDRNQWDDRNQRRDHDHDQTRNQDRQSFGGYSGSDKYRQQSQQDWNRPERGQHQQDWSNQQQQRSPGSGGRQQGGWHDDDGRSGDYRGNEWRGERDWGNPGYGGQSQPQQREWRGSSERLSISRFLGRLRYPPR